MAGGQEARRASFGDGTNEQGESSSTVGEVASKNASKNDVGRRRVNPPVLESLLTFASATATPHGTRKGGRV